MRRNTSVTLAKHTCAMRVHQGARQSRIWLPDPLRWQTAREQEKAAVAAVRRARKTTSGGRGRGNEPPRWERHIVRGRLRRKPANDNRSVHGGREALYVALGIVLTLGAWVLVVRALS